MKPTDDEIGLDMMDRSVIVTALEPMATRLGRAAKASRAVQASHAVAHAATRHGGITVLAAVATHVALVSLVVRPVSFYWLIIPAIFAAGGAILAALRQPGGHRGD